MSGVNPNRICWIDLAAIQREIYRHDFGTYVEDPRTIAQGGRGIVVAGCPACKKRLQSMNEFLRHPGKRCGASVGGPNFIEKDG